MGDSTLIQNKKNKKRSNLTPLSISNSTLNTSCYVSKRPTNKHIKPLIQKQNYQHIPPLTEVK